MPAVRSRASPFSQALARRRTVQDLGERRLLATLRPYLSPAGRQLLIGAREDDDAAAWRGAPGTVIGTVDTMVEGIDFRLDWPGYTYRLLGRRLMSINFSDLAAMGAWPRHALISLALPRTTWVSDVRALYRGIAERAEQFRCSVAGGDLSGIDGPLVATATVIGQIPPGRGVLRRSGARAGWSLAVTGSLGRAAAGLGLLMAGKRARTAVERAWVRAFADPQPRLEAARILEASGVRVAGDISDGLYREIGRIAGQAGLGAVVEGDRLPLDPVLRRGRDAWWNVLNESEDFELICAAPWQILEVAQARLRRDLRLGLTVIGSLRTERGLFVRGDGRLQRIEGEAGYDHFR